MFANGLAMMSSRIKGTNFQIKNNDNMKRLLSKLAQIKACIIAFVTYRFSLKSDEKVWVCVKNDRWVIKQATIKGFYAYGIAYKDHPYLNWNHYCNGLFYGFGYHNDGYVIVLKNKWLLPLAISSEKIRLFKW
jgi:hypothetical protein